MKGIILLLTVQIATSCSYLQRNQVYLLEHDQNTVTRTCKQDGRFGETALLRYENAILEIQVRYSADLGFFGPPLIPLLPFPWSFKKMKTDIRLQYYPGSGLSIDHTKWRLRFRDKEEWISPALNEASFSIQTDKFPKRIEVLVSGVQFNGQSQEEKIVVFSLDEKWVYDPFAFIHPRIIWPYGAPYPCKQ